MILMLACLGAVSTIGYKARETSFPAPPPHRDSNNRFLEYLNSPITP